MEKNYYYKNDEKIEYNIKTAILSATEKIVIADIVVSNIVHEGNKLIYIPLKDLTLDYALIKVITDINIDKYVLNDGTEEINPGRLEDFIVNSKLSPVMRDAVGAEVINELNYIIDKNLEYRTGIKIKDVGYEIASLVEVAKQKIKDIDVGSLVEIANKLKGFTGENIESKIVDSYFKTDMPNDIRDAVTKAQRDKIINLEKEIEDMKNKED